MSVLVRLLIISALAGATLASMGGVAAAGEAGRNCGTFYAQGDPSSGWGFTICVKLVHDPNAHTWWATASVTSTTPGISLFLSELEMRYAFGGTSGKTQLSSVDGQGSSTFVTGSTNRPWCSGSVSLDATAKGFARWPNGVGSYVQAVRTTPVPVYGTC
jgi:hypothetical protein